MNISIRSVENNCLNLSSQTPHSTGVPNCRLLGKGSGAQIQIICLISSSEFTKTEQSRSAAAREHGQKALLTAISAYLWGGSRSRCTCPICPDKNQACSVFVTAGHSCAEFNHYQVEFVSLKDGRCRNTSRGFYPRLSISCTNLLFRRYTDGQCAH